MMSSLSVRYLKVLLGGLCLVVVWILGMHQGQDKATEIVALARTAEQAQAAQQNARYQRALDEATQQLDRITRDRDVATARAAQLQKVLAERLQQSSQDAAELSLYRRIAGTELQRGLQVDQVQYDAHSVPEKLAVTLIQYRGRDRVSGHIGVSLVTTDQGDESRWVVTNPASEALFELEPGQPVPAVIPFDLRFFQTLLVSVGDVSTIHPDSVEITIQSALEGQEATVQRIGWGEVGEIVD